MGCDRIGFGADDDRFHATRAPRGGSDDEDDVDMDLAHEETKQGDDAERAREPLQQRRRVADEELHSDDTDIEEEMMRIDPVELEWRRQLHAGDPVDAQNPFGNWCPAMIQRILDGEVHVRYLNMNESWQRWLPIDSGQLAQPATKTRNDSAPLRLAQVIEVKKPGGTMWKEARVVKARPHDILVRYAGRQQQFDEWIPFSPATVAAAGDHIRARSFAQQRLLSVKPKVDRHRVIQTQNPRFQHYRDALASQGLQIHAVQGDGNCLFRSVSHQVYGDDRHHGLVRRLCMDYMESEKEYFEPYVVGDMADFLRYLEHKRRDGKWGDDPEIQAMCELYDRPAEVYAYDQTLGFRKLRTFHENSSLSRNRPPICLSYYGGGHYDSLVGTSHAENLIRDTPGEWEQRHIEYSRRINTREAQSGERLVGITQRVQDESDRETSEMAQLEQILMLSRNEFDAMNSNLDDTLKNTLAESEVSAAHSEQRALDAATRESEIAAIQAELIEKARQASEEEQVRKALEASLEQQLQHEQQQLSGALPTDADFDAQVSAAIQASLVESNAATGAISATARATGSIDEEEEMRRILELSAQEYELTSREQASAVQHATSAYGYALVGDAADADELDELQRAIQASLQDS